MFKTKPRDMIYIALFLALVLLLWAGLSLLPTPDLVQLPENSEGGYDLADDDFSDTVYLAAAVWQSWPGQLYTPEQLASVDEEPVAHDSLDYTSVRYSTHRMYLKLTPGVNYSISLGSINYAMRLYVDGEEVVSVGVPATTASETVSQERDVIYSFTPQSETTELIVHMSNFVHKQGGWAPTLTIGTPQNIAYLERVNNLKGDMVFACLITAFLYHLAIFMMNRQQRASLIFAALCFLLAFRSGGFIPLLLPEYYWHVSIRLEYITAILAAVMLALLVRTMFPGTLHAWVFRGYLAVSGVYLVVVLFTSSVFFSQVLIWFQGPSVAMTVYGLIRLAMALKGGGTKNLLAIVGIGLVGLFAVVDILHQNQIYGLAPERFFTTTTGMVFFVFCYALALAIEQAEVNHGLEEAKVNLAEAEARYIALLEEMQESSPPPAKLSDFGLTKRETEVALLLLDGRTRDEIAGLLFISMGTVNYHCSNIYRKAGVGSATEFAGLMRHHVAP